MTAAATHLVMSFSQTLMHYKLGHHPIGGKFFRNHINFHHTHYSKDHLVSATYLNDKGNNTPFFFIPVFAVGACMYFLLPVDLFVVLLGQRFLGSNHIRSHRQAYRTKCGRRDIG